MAVFDDVRDVLVQELAVKPDMVKPDAKLAEDLGADSLDAAEIVSALEDKFGINISDEEALQVASVAQIVQLIEQKLQTKPADQS
jgi:acyl carrier protein